MAQAKARSGSRRPGSKHRSLRYRRLRFLFLILGVATVFVLLVWPRPFSGGNEGTLKGPSSAPFQLTYPAGWERVGADKPSGGRKPLATLKRDDGKARVEVIKEGPLKQSFKKLSGGLTKAFKKRYKGFQQLSAKVIKVRKGRALFYSFLVSPKSKTVTSIILTPAGSISYLVRVTARRGDTQVGREIGKMLASFEPGPPSK